MPVEVKGRNKVKKATLICEKCGARSGTYEVQTAAPELEACEKAHEKEGWAYNIGFWAMLTGHTVYCPACSRASPQ